MFVNGIVVALPGKVAEWFKAAVLKTVVALSVTVSSNLTLSARSDQQTVWGGAGVDERSRLLSGCPAKNWTQGSNPCPPAVEDA